MTTPATRSRGRGGHGSGKRRGRGEEPVVPDAHFTSYYGRPILKASPWEADIPAYLFMGGVAAGSSLLAAGAELTGRPSLRRTGRVGAVVAVTGSLIALVHDLGRPARFVNMLRVAKRTSPMSVGTWILALYGPFAGLAAATEFRHLVPRRFGRIAAVLDLVDRPIGVIAALTAPPVASYTAVLLAGTATPTWHESRRQLPFVFVGSAAAAAGGLGMIGARVAEAGPARRLAVAGVGLELAAAHRMETRIGIAAEPLRTGKGGHLMKAARLLTTLGGVGALLSGRSRTLSVLSGAALMAGSACTRFGIFEAGQESARDPKYTVLPQRERVEHNERMSTAPAPRRIFGRPSHR